MDAAAWLLVVLALAFAVSIGAHYTGACMGMAHAAGAIRRTPALLLMAILTAVGATVASGTVVTNVGLGLVPGGSLSLLGAALVVGGAGALTAVYNQSKLPTSTIQIFVFVLVGCALAIGVPVRFATLAGLLAVWAVAPVLALLLGFLFTRLLPKPAASGSTVVPGRLPVAAAGLLVAAGAAASFAMGANDVANAVAVFVTTHLTTAVVAGAIGGVALAVGVLTWGRRLLDVVAFDIVRLDPSMAAGAQLGQGAVILGVVLTLGTFTSMNQALIGAMAGAGLARDRSTVRWPMVRGILLGWAIGPVSGFLVGYGLARLLAAGGVGL